MDQSYILFASTTTCDLVRLPYDLRRSVVLRDPAMASNFTTEGSKDDLLEAGLALVSESGLMNNQVKEIAEDKPPKPRVGDDS
jgi:hypothetical protein